MKFVLLFQLLKDQGCKLGVILQQHPNYVHKLLLCNEKSMELKQKTIRDKMIICDVTAKSKHVNSLYHKSFEILEFL